MPLYRIVVEDHTEYHFYVDAENPEQAEILVEDMGPAMASKEYSQPYDIRHIEEVSDEHL